MGRKLTLEEFVKRSSITHNNFYDYSKVEYVNSTIRVNIQCPIHGEFLQRPSHHLRGVGCDLCGIERARKKMRGTAEGFIKKANLKHNNFYDYSKVVYVDYATKVNIICPKHGSFLQIPEAHLAGQGCYKCGREKSIKKKTNTLDDFLVKAKSVHGNLYDYSKVVYLKKDKNVCIICKKHGEFFQSPNNHYKGNGCPICGNITQKYKINLRRLTKENFIERANKIHNNFYDYSKVIYEGKRKKINIICPKHGNFYVQAGNHMAGGGCPKCHHDKIALTQKDFIEKSIKIHGNKYDYSKAVYSRSDIKVPILCQKHGEFWQTPHSHMAGTGCPECGRKQITFKEFIEKASKKHKNKYNYDKAIYKGLDKKISIICSEHGRFWQTPSGHLKGNGCPKCNYQANSDRKKLSFEIFMERSRQVHGNKYDYSQTKYIDATTKRIEIFCPIHGKFYQRPVEHMEGYGCKKCAVQKRTKSIEEFISKSRIVHKDKYEYTKAKYKNGHTSICITCKKHGDFWQNPYDHEAGHGCPKCRAEFISRIRTLSTEEFIKRAKKVHGSRYDYSKTIYINQSHKVNILCKIHGKFKQSVVEHYNGSGCPKCQGSRGEQKIETWLDENRIKHEYHYRPSDLKTPDHNRSLEFDFYLPNINLFIEYDGEHHYRPVTFNGISMEEATKNFERDKFHDELKNKYCNNKNIPLLRIPYTEFKKIPEILNEKLLKLTSEEINV